MKAQAAIAITTALALTACGSQGPSDPTTNDQTSALVQVAGDSDGCTTLFAGQTIDAGTVCLEVDNNVDTSAQCGAGAKGVVNVTFMASGGWELTEAHLWAGTSISTMPQTKQGNPKIGNFPYNAGNITGQTSHVFAVPLCDFGLDASDTTCADTTALLAAHASLRKDNGDGSYQTETGWGDGDRFVQKGSWGTYYGVLLECVDDDDPPPPVALDCETAWAKGPYTFACYTVDGKTAPGDAANYNCIPGAADGGDYTSGWGWYGLVPVNGTISSTLYAGAGKNDISKSMDAGTATVTCSAGTCNFLAVTKDGFRLEDYQVTLSCSPIDTQNPGQFDKDGHVGANWSDNVSYSGGSTSYSGNVSLAACASGSYYYAIHTSVCRPKI